MDSEIIAIMNRVYQAHGAILELGINPYLQYKRRSLAGRYAASLRGGYVGYTNSTLTAGFLSDDPMDALRQAAAYADANAVSEDEDA